jgi:GT2 family glycosyltransferase
MPEGPFFSIIVPTHDRIDQLALCLGAMRQLEYPRSDFEVIVVDDASIMPAETLAAHPAIEVGVRFLRTDTNQGPAAARNLGARHARGRYLAFTDDDCLPPPDWLQKLRNLLEVTPASMVGGPVASGSPNSLCSAASAAILEAVFRHYNHDHRNARFLTTANLSLPAALFSQIGGFNPEFRTSEDREFCARWLREGFPLLYAPEAVMVHRDQPNLREFYRRHYNYGKGAYRFRAQSASREGEAVKLEPSAFYWQLLRSPFVKGFGARAALIAFLVLVSQLASALGFFAEWRGSKGESRQLGDPSSSERYRP